MAKEPASIRYRNPGAMWGSALAIKWGAKPNAVTLNDGKGQGNNIAVFPTYVAGICAQLDLWRTSRHYKNKRFCDAIAIWSGGNSVESYIAFVLKRVPGMTRNTVMNDAFWQSASGIAFLKAQAWHEAGKQYPAPDEDWLEAQRLVFDGEVATEEVDDAPPPEQPSVLSGFADKVVPIGRTIAGLATGGAVSGQVASSVSETPSVVAEKTTQVATKTGEVIAATTQTVSVPKPGLWNGVLSFISSPGFLVSMVVVIAAMWLLVYLVQRQQKQAVP